MFSLEPSEEQRMIQDTARSFAIDQLRPHSHECDEHGSIPNALLASAWELGLVSAVIPEACGGSGMERSAVTGVLVLEELAWGDLSMTMAMMAPALFAYPVLTAGTDAQKEKYLPLFCGSTVPTLTAAVMEPSLAFDLSELGCKATPKGDGFTLAGKKCLVPLGSSAEKFLVYAAIDGKAGYDNVGAFVVDRAQPGVSVGERERNMGLIALDTAGLTLDNVEVGPDDVLGGSAGCGFGRLMSYSRVALCALSLGVARAANEYARDYAKERSAFGEPIAHRQAISFMIAEDLMEIEAARLLTWEAAWQLDADQPSAFKAAYLAKLYAEQMVVKATDDAVQSLGGHGYIREHPVELWLRNGRGFSTFEGLATV
ncbi:MAG: acyl-CoA dehydrogenase family protein [Smithellaceae bacterium]|nr:acyl-CoA dehydrogenase family protein [Smithellaceae bacterium]